MPLRGGRGYVHTFVCSDGAGGLQLLRWRVTQYPEPRFQHHGGLFAAGVRPPAVPAAQLRSLQNPAPKRLTIALLNIFLGWTVVGWLVAMVMAVKKPEVTLPDGEESGYFDSELLVRGFSIVPCPKCGEKVRDDAVKCKHCGTSLTPAT